MRHILFIFILFLPFVGFAANMFVAPVHVNDVMSVSEPEASRTYYGELAGFPHTYEIHAAESFFLHTQVLEPVSKNATKNISLIVIRERDNGRGVETIGRLRAKEALWEKVSIDGVRYFSGGVFEGEMRPGVYRVEVSTQINQGKYALVLGSVEQEENGGYVASLTAVYEVQRFLGKPPITMIANPLVYVPLLILLCVVFVGVYFKRKYA